VGHFARSVSGHQHREPNASDEGHDPLLPRHAGKLKQHCANPAHGGLRGEVNRRGAESEGARAGHVPVYVPSCNETEKLVGSLLDLAPRGLAVSAPYSRFPRVRDCMVASALERLSVQLARLYEGARR